MFDIKLYLKIATVLLLLVSAAMVIISWVAEPVNATDKFGTIATTLIIAYIIQIMWQMKKD